MGVPVRKRVHAISFLWALSEHSTKGFLKNSGNEMWGVRMTSALWAGRVAEVQWW